MEMKEQDKEWLEAYSSWAKSGKQSIAPRKPDGFDLRLQGNDPMKLKGFGKKPPNKWHSSAKVPEWPSEKWEQTNFDL